MRENEKAAKAAWDAERALMAKEHPDWPMPAWSRTPAWRKRPYFGAVTSGA
jgi:hypothetical protein